MIMIELNIYFLFSWPLLYDNTSHITARQSHTMRYQIKFNQQDRMDFIQDHLDHMLPSSSKGRIGVTYMLSKEILREKHAQLLDDVIFRESIIRILAETCKGFKSASFHKFKFGWSLSLNVDRGI